MIQYNWKNNNGGRYMSEKGKNFLIAFIVILIIAGILAGGVYFARKKLKI